MGDDLRGDDQTELQAVRQHTERAAPGARLRRVAFVTRLEHPALTADDALAVEPCAERGLGVTAAPWDDDGVDWQRFDAIVLRSCWDYHLRPARFIAWLHALRRTRIPLINPRRACLWNLRKTYLLTLAHRGVPVPPTLHLPRGAHFDVAAAARALGSSDLVAKPVIGASGWQLFRVSPALPASVTRLGQVLRRRSMLLQPWLAEVLERGEWSLTFFDGDYHHAAHKNAAPGEFRVQAEFGGGVRVAEPSAELRSVATRALRVLPRTLPYARVDLVETAAGPLVTELELIEPELFLRCHPAAPRRFADVLAATVAATAANS